MTELKRHRPTLFFFFFFFFFCIDWIWDTEREGHALLFPQIYIKSSPVPHSLCLSVCLSVCLSLCHSGQSGRLKKGCFNHHARNYNDFGRTGFKEKWSIEFKSLLFLFLLQWIAPALSRKPRRHASPCSECMWSRFPLMMPTPRSTSYHIISYPWWEEVEVLPLLLLTIALPSFSKVRFHSQSHLNRSASILNITLIYGPI